MAGTKGNCNALKHGLYAKHFSPAESAELRNMSPKDFEHELYMMRVVVKNLFELHTRLVSEKPIDVEELTKVTNSLSLAVTALNTTARTHALLTGKDTSLNDAFEEALNSLPVFLDDKYLSETNAEVDGSSEILALPE